MDVDRCRHNNKGFCKKIRIPKVYKSGEHDHNRGAHASLVEILPSSLPLVVMSVKEEIRFSGDCVDTARGRTLERMKNSFKLSV